MSAPEDKPPARGLPVVPAATADAIRDAVAALADIERGVGQRGIGAAVAVDDDTVALVAQLQLAATRVMVAAQLGSEHRAVASIRWEW